MFEGLQERLCELLCAEVTIHKRDDNVWMLDTPFTFPDGDAYPLYLSKTVTSGVRISDLGHTLMHISYETDIDNVLEGRRHTLMQEIVSQSEVGMDDEKGHFFIETSTENLASAVFSLGQVLTRVYDLTFLDRSRVSSTFYEDLEKFLTSIVEEERIEKDYVVPSLVGANNYPIDFYIKSNKGDPVFLYGIPSRDKVRLTTIFLQHFLSQGISFESVLVFEDQEKISRADLARLSNGGGEMIASMNATDDLRRKVLKKVA